MILGNPSETGGGVKRLIFNKSAREDGSPGQLHPRFQNRDDIYRTGPPGRFPPCPAAQAGRSAAPLVGGNGARRSTAQNGCQAVMARRRAASGCSARAPPSPPAMAGRRFPRWRARCRRGRERSTRLRAGGRGRRRGRRERTGGKGSISRPPPARPGSSPWDVHSRLRPRQTRSREPARARGFAALGQAETQWRYDRAGIGVPR